MPRKTMANHPDHARTKTPRAPQADLNDRPPKADHFPPQQSLEPSARLSGADVSQLLQRDDGWLRIVPDADGKTVWWKWKITRGKWSGYYVMCVGRQDEHSEAIAVMLHKLSKVDSGDARPTKDSYYDQG